MILKRVITNDSNVCDIIIRGDINKTGIQCIVTCILVTPSIVVIFCACKCQLIKLTNQLYNNINCLVFKGNRFCSNNISSKFIGERKIRVLFQLEKHCRCALFESFNDFQSQF